MTITLDHHHRAHVYGWGVVVVSRESFVDRLLLGARRGYVALRHLV